MPKYTPGGAFEVSSDHNIYQLYTTAWLVWSCVAYQNLIPFTVTPQSPTQSSVNVWLHSSASAIANIPSSPTLFCDRSSVSSTQ